MYVYVSIYVYMCSLQEQVHCVRKHSLCTVYFFTYIYVHIYIYIHTYTYAYIYKYTYIYIYIQIHIHTRIYTHMHMKICMYIHIHIHIYLPKARSLCEYGVATISRLLEIVGLFCKRAL